MKKIFFFLFLFFLPMISNASNRYEVEDYKIEAFVEENGNLKVNEFIVLNGNVESFYKNIYYRNSRYIEKDPYDFTHDGIHNGTGLENIRVSYLELKKDEIFSLDRVNEFEPLQRIYYEEDKTDREYVESSHQDGKTLKLFYQQNDARVVFFFTYEILDVVVTHQDISEIYWTFINSEFQSNIENLQIKIYLPHQSNADYLKAWIHGDLLGQIHFDKNQIITASMKKIAKETGIHLRITFDSSVLKDSKKETDVLAFEKISDLEEKKIQEEHAMDKKNRKITDIIVLISETYLSFLFLWWIYVYFRFDREYKKPHIELGKTKIIQDYSIEVVDAFLNNEVTYKAFLCSFLNLIYKKNIRLSFWHRRKDNYEFILDHREGTTHTEDVLLDLLFEKIGKKNKFTLNEFKRFVEEKPNMFQKNYWTWQNCVEKDLLREKFYEQNGQPIISSIFLLLFSFFLLFANIYFGTNLVFPWIVFFFACSFFFYSMFIKKRSKKGNHDYYSWLLFQEFLDKIDNEEIEEENLDLYLLYSILFHKENKLFLKLSKKTFLDKAMVLKVKKEFQNAIENKKSI